jgi:SSS family solute:Na+ symporter
MDFGFTAASGVVEAQRAVGIAFAAIGIGALVSAAIMSIAAANLYTRNIHRDFINANPTDKQAAQMAMVLSVCTRRFND